MPSPAKIPGPTKIPGPAKNSGPVKRSVTLSGHRTSLTIEPEFWVALVGLAQDQGQSVSALVAQIDAQRAGEGLSSAVRVHVLGAYRDQIAALNAAAAEADHGKGNGAGGPEASN